MAARRGCGGLGAARRTEPQNPLLRQPPGAPPGRSGAREGAARRPSHGTTAAPAWAAARGAAGAKRGTVERPLRTEGPPRVYLDARSETATLPAVKKGKQVTNHPPVTTADPRKHRREGFRAL